MGKRGPAPLPTSIKLLHGETRPSRLNPDAPRPIARLPIPPADMDPRAREVWDRQIESMAATGVLTPVDTDSLRAYCEAVSRYEVAARLLASSGPVVRGARSGPCDDCGHGSGRHPRNGACREPGCACRRLAGGELVKNPLHQVVRDNAMLIRAFAMVLGFVPSGREGIHPGEVGTDADPFDKWLEAGG